MHGRTPGAIIALIVIISAGIALALATRAKKYFAPTVLSPSNASAQVGYTTTVRDTGYSAVVDVDFHNSGTASADVTIEALTLNDILSKTPLPVNFTLAPGKKKRVTVNFGDRKALSYGTEVGESISWSDTHSATSSNYVVDDSTLSLTTFWAPDSRGKPLKVAFISTSEQMYVTLTKLVVDGKRSRITLPPNTHLTPGRAVSLPPIHVPRSVSGRSVDVVVQYDYRRNPLAQLHRHKETLQVWIP
jgi:hypothetical protein